MFCLWTIFPVLPAVQAQDTAARSAGQQEGETGDGTRAGEAIARRRARMEDLRPARMSGAEKALLWAEEQIRDATPVEEATSVRGFLDLPRNPLFNLPEPDWRDHLLPVFGQLRPGAGLAAGVRFWHPKTFGSQLDLELVAASTLARTQFYQARIGKIELFPFTPIGPPPQEMQNAATSAFYYLDLSYRYFPEEEFFGLGPDTSEADRSDFLLEQGSYEFVAGVRHRRWLTVSGSAGFLQVDTGPGGDSGLTNTDVIFQNKSGVDFSRPPDFFKFSASALIDFRDVPENPSRGVFAGFGFTRYDDHDDDRFEFHRYKIEAQGYLPLGSRQRVLAVQGLVSKDDERDGARVPFFLQQTLGDSRTLRGFSNYRFRGEKMIHLSAEYRWEAHANVELAAFYDTGRVFLGDQGLAFNHLKKSFGIGVRFKGSRGVFLRTELAKSDEQTRFHFTFGPTF